MSPDHARLTLDDVPSLLTVGEAAAATRLSPEVIRAAILRGDLEAFIPLGRDPAHAGRGLGYRIHRKALESWFFRGLL